MKYLVCGTFMCLIALSLLIKDGKASPYVIVDRGFCNETYTVRFNTECQHCDINVFTDCPFGSVKETVEKGISGCEYTQSLGPGYNETKTGCYHTCLQDKQDVKCCPGYWGPQCQDCPGGATSVCSGHGQCDETLNGTGLCTCEAGFTGYACELCLNQSLSGQNCSLVLPTTDAACENKTCPEHSECMVVDGDALCACQWPYVDQEGTDNSTTNCSKVDMCQVPPLCHVNAFCDTNHEPTVEKNCTCMPGFHGDGYVCDPTNPCQFDNGGCPEESTNCINELPGKSYCKCLPGFTEFVPVHGCHLIDVCRTNGSQCHSKATCKTTAPFTMTCTCLDGYTGNGKVCSGSILQTIQDLDEDDDSLRGQLSLIQSAIEKYYSTEMTNHGPFTMFVPINAGFRTTNTANFQKWLDDGERVRRILRQHILVGEFHTEQLLNQSVFYTLQGVGAELQAGRGNTLRFNLYGDRKALLLKKNILASNGMIHVVNKLMTNPPPATGNQQLLITEVVKNNGQFNRFEMLMKAAGPEIESLLEQDNITVFIPSNGAFDSLPDASGAMEYLQSMEGVEKLKAILKSHIVNEKVEVAELINKMAVDTVANVRIAVNVQKNGAVMLNSEVRITQADIEASNGLLYAVDTVLLPAGVSPLPSQCNNYTYKVVKGPCSSCVNEQVCYGEDKYMNETASCVYFDYWRRSGIFYRPWYSHRRPFITSFRLPGLRPGLVKRTGCAALCNRTYTTTECCAGFYGPDCLPCPGGYENPCNGHGKCDDKISGHGTCSCDENFSGEACEKCSRENYFGSNCSQECTCIQGTCNSGLLGDGLCNKNLGCKGFYAGDNCDKKSIPCSSATSRDFCHAHAECISTEEKNEYSCICKPGYRGNGEDCMEINPCIEEDRGGCDIQATCTKTAPGLNQCTCNRGWTGDGTYCYPSSSCSNHSDCSSDAQCLETTPGDHVCICKTGFHGDGKSCVLTDLCTVDNGNCHPKAICVPVGPGQVNCSCPVDQGYIGDGYHCYGNLITQIQDHPNLTLIAQATKQFSTDDLELFLDDDYTAFFPNDNALKTFFSKSNLHWLKTDNTLTLMNYHVLQNKSSIVRWLALASVYDRIETMADGFTIHIFKEGKTVMLSPSKGSPVKARVLEADILATNGYLNIIDQVLEPYMPESPDTYPDLETFFNNTPNCSIFGKWLKEKNLIDKLEIDLNQYTLFVPSDTYARTINVTSTTDFLRYYFLPKMKMTASVDDSETVVTDLGGDHQLVYRRYGWNNVTINNVPISTPDIFTLGGIVNVIDGLLHPVLHWCNKTTKSVEFGTCHECGASYLCPPGYTVYQGSDNEVRDCYYSVRKLFTDILEKGCQGLCVVDSVTKDCCSGFFGPTCQECPGGPETPCHGNGYCSDGLQGNGQCVCTGHFTGLECNKCVYGWTGPSCNIDMFGCGYRNGGCHKAAACHREDNGKISCKCRPGYRGDGYNCTGPCELLNGGCHRNANCLYEAAVGVTCSCKTGYVGDGKKACNGDVYSTLVAMNATSQFLKSISLADDGNMTKDLLQSMGSSKVVVFVPVSNSLKNRVLTADELKHHIVLINDTVVRLDNSEKLNLTTIAGDELIQRFDTQTNTFFVDNIKVVKTNIICTNGAITLISSPLTKPPMRSKTPQSAPPIIAIVIPVVGVIIFAAIVVIVVVIYRKTRLGYWQLFHKWVPNQQNAADTLSQARLSFSDPDTASISSRSTGNTNFGNPLYKMNEDDL